MALMNRKKNSTESKHDQAWKVNKKQQDQASVNRGSGETLLALLRGAEANLKGLKTPDSQEIFRQVTQSFENYVENASSIASYDLTEIDKLLEDMIKIYSNALKEGDLDTAKRAVDRIHAGLLEFRTEIDETDKERRDAVLKDRIKKLGGHKSLLAASETAFINRKNIIKKEKEYKERYSEYETLYQTVDEEIEKRPDLFKVLKELRPGLDEVPADAAKMFTDIRSLNLISEQVEDIKRALEVLRSQYNAQINSIKSLQTMLSVRNGILSDEDEARMREVVEQYRKDMQDAMLSVQRMEQLQEERILALKEMYKSHGFGMQVLSHMTKFEELKQRREQNQKNVEEGMKHAQEVEQANEKQILNN
jgi:hypothetical protein